MEIRQLEYFCEAAKHEHISRAAEALFISQPALSRTIRNLEEELGVSLFEPFGRGIHLTQAGNYFYSVASHVLSELDTVRREFLFQNSLSFNGIYATNQAPEIFRYLLRGFFKAHPGIPVFETSNKEDAMEGAENTHNGFILSYQQSHLRGFCCERLAVSPYVLLVPATHNLSSQESVSLSNLHGEAQIAYSALRLPSFFEDSLPYPNYMMSDLASVVRLISQNYGISILPSVFLRLFRQEASLVCPLEQMPVMVPLSDCPEQLQIFLTWPEKEQYASHEVIFLNYCREFFRLL